MAAEIFLHDVDTFLECRLLIAHPNRARILTIRRAEAWALPALTPLEQHKAAVGHINRAVYRLFGLKTFVRRLVSESPGNSGYRKMVSCYELEVVGELARQRIRRTAWVGKTELDEIDFETEFDRETIESWLREFESAEESSDPSTGDTTGRPRWSRPGWFETASSWIQRNASGLDAPTQATPDQHWTDDRMVVLSSPSASGQIVMTATTSSDSRANTS